MRRECHELLASAEKQGIGVDSAPNVTSIWPAIRSCSTREPPRYGTYWTCTPVNFWSNRPLACDGPPGPLVPKDILVLFDLIHPISSIRSMAGTAFLDSTSNGVLLRRGRLGGNVLGIARAPDHLDPRALLRPTKLAQALPERCNADARVRVALDAHEHADPSHALGLLRARRERPRRRAAEECDEVAPVQLIELHHKHQPEARAAAISELILSVLTRPRPVTSARYEATPGGPVT